MGWARRHRADRSRAGMTLIELLLVIGLLAVMAGGGMGVFAALDLEKNQATGLVKSAMRAARDTSRSQDLPTRVRIDPLRATLQRLNVRVIGTWHFEDEGLIGAFGVGGRLEGAALSDEGWIGRALAFEAGGPGAVAVLGVDRSSLYDLHEGFGIDVWIRLDEDAVTNLIDVGKVCGLQLTREGRLQGWFAPQVEDEFSNRGRGAITVALSEPNVLPYGRWVRLQLVYDRVELALLVDGVRVASALDDRPVWKVDGPMELGDRRRMFPGALDTLVITAAEAVEELELPVGVNFASDSASEIWFEAGGRLDRRRHIEPAVIGLVRDDGSREDVRIGLYGTVDALEVGL